MSKGFTLIELLVVCTILGILIMVAYPQYRNDIVRARRSDGQTALLDLANRLERYYAQHDTYQGASDFFGQTKSAEGWYHLAITNTTDSSYLLQATPLAAQATNDPHCPILTLDNLGTAGCKTEIK